MTGLLRKAVCYSDEPFGYAQTYYKVSLVGWWSLLNSFLYNSTEL